MRQVDDYWPYILFIDHVGWSLKGPVVWFEARRKLGPLSTDSPGQLDVLGHDGDPLGVDGAEVGVFEEPNQVSLAGLLQSHHRAGLESQVGLEILSNLPDQPLEGQLADQQLGGLLVSPDLPEGYGAWPVSVGLLHSSGGWC